MTKENIFERLTAIFRDVFDDETIVVTETTKSSDIEDWDSLEHLNILNAIEEEFGMMFTMNEATASKDMGGVADIILERATK